MSKFKIGDLVRPKGMSEKWDKSNTWFSCQVVRLGAYDKVWVHSLARLEKGWSPQESSTWYYAEELKLIEPLTYFSLTSVEFCIYV